jgi:hypothetical protein
MFGAAVRKASKKDYRGLSLTINQGLVCIEM